MARIVFIGAGSVVFTRNLVRDILTFAELDGSELILMDIHAERLKKIEQLVKKLIAVTGRRVTVRATMDRREALTGADYVMVTIRVGGTAAWKINIDIPARYGVSQCVGDTLGPAGIFAGLRHLAVVDEITHDMEEVCPHAFVLQYSNPMAILTWCMTQSSIPTVGLCHSVQGTAKMLAEFCDVPAAEISYWVAGINHQAWFLRLEHQGHDLYPRLRAHLHNPKSLAAEPVRFELMRRFGYFVTESSRHASEYYAYFRKRPDLLDRLLASFITSTGQPEGEGYGRTGEFVERAIRREADYEKTIQNQIQGIEPIEVRRSDEYGARIIHAIETGSTLRINGNVANTGLITNLPANSCVEVPCLVDRTGIHPCSVGALPPQLAAHNRNSIAVQELTVQGHLERSRERIFQAMALDPLTAAVCSLDEIAHLTEEMFAANEPWLPQFH